jgi:hypothetical protein
LYQVVLICITSLELLITQNVITDKNMQCQISNNDMLLSTSWETWYAHQNTPLLLLYSKSPLNDTSKGNARNWTPHISLGWSRTMMKFWYMVCASFERGMIPYSVWITRVHKIIGALHLLVAPTRHL